MRYTVLFTNTAAGPEKDDELDLDWDRWIRQSTSIIRDAQLRMRGE